MNWFGWITIVVDAVLAVTAIVKWRHARTAQEIGDVLIDVIESASVTHVGRKDLKRHARTESQCRGVGDQLHARVKAKGYSGGLK